MALLIQKNDHLNAKRNLGMKKNNKLYTLTPLRLCMTDVLIPLEVLKMTVLNTNSYDHTASKMFFDDALGMQRFDTLKYRAFDKLTDKQLGFFWRPEEVDILRDAADFKNLTEHEQHIFTSN